MASASRTETYDIPAEKFFQVVTDYASYPDFVDGISDVEIIEENDKGAEVRFILNLIKTFEYTLRLKHEKPNKVSWTLVEGDFFKKNEGGWDFKDLGNGKTEVTYSLDVDLKMMVPKMITKKLVGSNLPSMMKSYYQRAKEL